MAIYGIRWIQFFAYMSIDNNWSWFLHFLICCSFFWFVLFKNLMVSVIIRITTVNQLQYCKRKKTKVNVIFQISLKVELIPVFNEWSRWIENLLMREAALKIWYQFIHWDNKSSRNSFQSLSMQLIDLFDTFWSKDSVLLTTSAKSFFKACFANISAAVFNSFAPITVPAHSGAAFLDKSAPTRFTAWTTFVRSAELLFSLFHEQMRHISPPEQWHELHVIGNLIIKVMSSSYKVSRH